MNSDLLPRIRRNIEDNHPERHYIFEEFDPRVEISDSPECYFLLVHIPGFSRENVRVEIDNRGALVMRGERRFQRRGFVGWQWQGMGDVCQRLKKAIMVPDNVDLDGICARVEKGILYIFMPKLRPGEFTWIEVGEEEEPPEVRNGIMIEDDNYNDDEGEPNTPIVDIPEVPGSSNMPQNPAEEDEELQSQSPIFPPTPSPQREMQEEPQTPIFLPELDVREPVTFPSPLPESPSPPSPSQESPHPIGVSPTIPSSPILSPPPTPSPPPPLQESPHPIDVSPPSPSSPVVSPPPTPSPPPPLQESPHPIDVSPPITYSPIVSPPPTPSSPPLVQTPHPIAISPPIPSSPILSPPPTPSLPSPLQESPHPTELPPPIPSSPMASPPSTPPISLPPLALPETPSSPIVSPLPVTEFTSPRPRTPSPPHSPLVVPQPSFPPLTSPPMSPKSPPTPAQSPILPPTPIPNPALPIPLPVEQPLPSSLPTPPQYPLPLPKSPQHSPSFPASPLLPETPSPILPLSPLMEVEIQVPELKSEKEVASPQEPELSSEEEEEQEAEEEGSVRSGPSPFIINLLIPIGVCIVACIVAYSMRRHRLHKHQKH